MELGTNIGLFGKQSLAITARVIQSIRLLQYGQDELSEFLAEQAERNPLIEVLSGPGRKNAASAGTTDGQPAKAGTAGPHGPGGRATHGTAGRDMRSLEDFCAVRVSLRDHLLNQAAVTFAELADRHA